MTNRLLNKSILITRPVNQAENLSKLILEKKARPVLFPTIEIRSINNSDSNTFLFDKLDEYYGIIFVSRNAVYRTFDFYLKKKSLSMTTKLFAIGASTTLALKESGVDNVIYPDDQADSEALLKHDDLGEQFIKNKKILIVRGVGGREYLADTLIKRGAEINYAEVYERCLPKYDRNFIMDLWQNVKPDIVVATSGEGLKNLLILTPDAHQQALLNTPLVLMSDRLLGIAKEVGFISKMEAAAEKDDQGIMSALLKLVGEG